MKHFFCIVFYSPFNATFSTHHLGPCISKFQHGFYLFYGSSLRSIPYASAYFTLTAQNHSSPLLFLNSLISSFSYLLVTAHSLSSLLHHRGLSNALPALSSRAGYLATTHQTLLFYWCHRSPNSNSSWPVLDLQSSHYLAKPGEGSLLTVITNTSLKHTQGLCVIGQGIHFNDSFLLPFIKPILVLRCKCPQDRGHCTESQHYDVQLDAS